MRGAHSTVHSLQERVRPHSIEQRPFQKIFDCIWVPCGNEGRFRIGILPAKPPRKHRLKNCLWPLRRRTQRWETPSRRHARWWLDSTNTVTENCGFHLDLRTEWEPLLAVLPPGRRSRRSSACWGCTSTVPVPRLRSMIQRKVPWGFVHVFSSSLSTENMSPQWPTPPQEATASFPSASCQLRLQTQFKDIGLDLCVLDELGPHWRVQPSIAVSLCSACS